MQDADAMHEIWTPGLRHGVVLALVTVISDSHHMLTTDQRKHAYVSVKISFKTFRHGMHESKYASPVHVHHCLAKSCII